MRAYGYYPTKHILDDCDVAGVYTQGAPTRKAGGRVRNKAATRRHFAKKARAAAKAACRDGNEG